MSFVAPRTNIWRIAASTAALLLLALAGAPSAAIAQFTGIGQASSQYGAADLPAPAAAATNITITCERHGNDLSVTISVAAYGTVPRANYYQITIIPPTGPVITTELTQTSGRLFTFASNRKDGVEWAYQLQGQYKVPGVSNVWYGDILSGTLTCK
ncbi:hypothetical protein AB4Y87_25270 [Paenarthrobacter sp. RAF54_2]|uniref:hypothetical protein n=1 Tax=Paenarthrobacter sp. RAF54_2 TaxID=3233061 RepID=UPI003F9ACA62